MANDGENLLTVREVAQRCQRSEETVRRWIWSGKLRARKLGNQLFVEQGDVQGPSAQRRPRVVSERPIIVPARYDRAALRALEERERKLRDELFNKYGYIDVAALVRDSRESH